MGKRLIRDGLLDSEKVNSLSPEAERFFVRLMLVVDDFGKYDARASILTTRCFPLGNEPVHRVEMWIEELVKTQIITRYTVMGKDYILINNFGQRLRVKKSKFPNPVGGLPQDAALCGDFCQPSTSNSSSTSGSDSDSDSDSNSRRGKRDLKEIQQDFIDKGKS